MDRWDLSRLEVFLTIAQTGSLTKARSLLGMEQPGISRQLARLEADCGGRLFYRTGRGMTLSELGTRVLPRVEAMLREAAELSAEVSSHSQVPSGHVRLGTLPSLYKALVVPIFFQLREQLPLVQLQVFEGSAGQIDQWLSTGFVDLGLPYRYGDRIPTDVDRLVTVSSYLVGPHGDSVTDSPTVKFSRLNGLPLVLPGTPSSVRLLLDQLARHHHIVLDVVLEADSVQIQRSIIENKGAYGILPYHAVLEEIKEQRLQASMIVDPEITRSVVLGHTLARPPSLATRAVAMHIRQFLSERSETFQFRENRQQETGD